VQTLHNKSYAKINWFLNVFPLEEIAQFHSLETVMQRIELADSISVALRNDSHIHFTVSCGSCDCSMEDNIIVKAAQLFRKHTAVTNGLDISIEKYIPVGAGLGGGSSNAATTLRILNSLFDYPLSNDELLFCAAQLGADVPFFFSTPCALCKGRGELCAPLTPHRYSIVLWKPNVALSTADIYARFDTRSRPQKSSEEFCKAYSQNSLTKHPELIWNNLAVAASEALPRLNRMQSHALEAGALTAHVSGSGPTLVALCRDDAHALEVMHVIRSSYAHHDDFITSSQTIT